MSRASIASKADKACWEPAFVLLRDPQSGDLIKVSFPAALVTSEEKMPARPA